MSAMSVAAFGFRGVLFGVRGPVDETQCVREAGSAVCVDRRGSELDLRAEGLVPGSVAVFDGERFGVGDDGELLFGATFETNEHTLQGPIDIKARASNGRAFAGTVEFWPAAE